MIWAEIKARPLQVEAGCLNASEKTSVHEIQCRRNPMAEMSFTPNTAH